MIRCLSIVALFLVLSAGALTAQTVKTIGNIGGGNVIPFGLRSFETATRNTLDLSSVPVLRELTHLPVIVDPSHAAGRHEIVGSLCRAARAIGADGAIVEMHPKRAEALCDARQALSPGQLCGIAQELQGVERA